MRYLFVGNRRFVLEEMIRRDIDLVGICVIAGTHLERDMANINLPHQLISSKSQLLNLLESTDFDVLISNGCPFIFPINDMKPAKYVNIHPSCLPDLKGADPAIGSILFSRDGGATCHLMNAEIDAGDIIAQVRIPFSPDLDVSLMYQLSFIAEKQVFHMAAEMDFTPECSQPEMPTAIYYSRKPEDRVLTFKEGVLELERKIKAFSNKSQGCEFSIRGRVFRVHQFERLHNSFLLAYAELFDDYEVILNYEDSIVFRDRKELILLRSLTDSLADIPQHTKLIC